VTEPAAIAANVSRVYPARRGAPAVRALDDLSLAIGPGEHVALLGPNGAGKSTLLRLLTGLDRPTAGEVRVLGSAPERARDRLGVVFQRPSLDPVLTIRENLALAAALYGVASPRDRLEEVAEQLEIADRLGSRVGTLSGGLARRADLARALAPAPDLLILDEPTTGLDHAARASFLAALDARRAERPALAILMSTHLMDEARRATRVALLDRGRLVAEGSPDELRASVGAARLLHAPREARAALERAGLEISQTPGGLTGAGDAAQLELAAGELLRAGVSFEVAPPTLGDVYLRLTGRALAPEPAGETAA